MPFSGTGNTLSKTSKESNKNKKGKKATEEKPNLDVRLSDLGQIKRTPSEAELHIQSERISYILQRSIDKLKVALCLPHFLKHDAAVLHRCFQNPDVELIQHVCAQCAMPRNVQQLRQVAPFQTISSAVNRIGINEPKIKGKLERTGYYEQLLIPQMTQVVEMLIKAHGLKNQVIVDFARLVDIPCITFVDSMESIKEIAEKKLSVTASEQRAYERSLSKAWKANFESEDMIYKLYLQLEKQREDVGKQEKEKQATTTEYQNRIDGLMAKYHLHITKKVVESEKGMAEDSSLSAIRQASLAVEAKAVTHQYESLLAKHLIYEKGLRAKRTKVETQLSSWLAKFDSDMGERQTEFEELTKCFEEEKMEMEALQERFDDQEVEYVVLMTEKEEEERRIFEGKAYKFLCNRAARRIQRYWRDYRIRKIEKKKAKKAKGKPKKQKSTESVLGDEGGTKSKSKEKISNKEKPSGEKSYPAASESIVIKDLSQIFPGISTTLVD